MRLAWDVARRYLAPRRGGQFLSFITWISLGGVTVGVTALIVVIAVMTGAKEDFQEKILESNPHVLVLEQSSSLRMSNWRPVLDTIKGARGVVSATPFVLTKVTIVLRRSYGGSNITMGCSKMGPDFIYAWPTVEFAPTGPEMMVQAVFNKELEKAKEDGNYEELFERYVSILREQFSVMNMGKIYTHWYTVHEVIDPRDSRSRIIKAIHASLNKHEEMPDKKRHIKPA